MSRAGDASERQCPDAALPAEGILVSGTVCVANGPPPSWMTVAEAWMFFDPVFLILLLGA